MNPDDPLADLTDRYFQGRISAEDAAALSRLLTGDPAAAERFAELTRLESGLRDAFREDGRGALFGRRLERAEAEAEPAPVRNWRRPMTIAAALALAGGVGLALRPFLETQPASPAGPSTVVGPRIGKAAGAWTPSGVAKSDPAGDAREMRQRLRNFYLPEAAPAAEPLSAALKSLEALWTALPHEEKVPAPVFTVAESVMKRWKDKDSEPAVARGVPGISLLTGLNLIAAQADLRVEVTGEGATLVADTRPVPAGEKTWTLALNREAVAGVVTAAADAEVIDLNLLPEVIDFEGFINYGTPIETAGANGEERATAIIGYEVYSFNKEGVLMDSASGATIPSRSVPDVPNVTDLKNKEGEELVDALVTAGVEDQTIMQFHAALVKDRAELARLQETFGARHPKVIGLKKSIESELEILVAAAGNYRDAAVKRDGSIRLTDSGITQAVFSQLQGLFFRHGASGIQESWDEAGTVLLVTGQVPSLRKAEALVQALNESSQAGAGLEVVVMSVPQSVSADLPMEELKAHQDVTTVAYPSVQTALRQPAEISVASREGDSLLQANLTADRKGAEYDVGIELYNGSLQEKCRQHFRQGLGYFDLGRFKEAEESFNRVLAIDPTNVAARKQLERTEKEVNSYLQASRDHTRVKMLNDVDSVWATPVPGETPEPGLTAPDVSMQVGSITDDFDRPLASGRLFRGVQNRLTLLPGEWQKAGTHPGDDGTVLVFFVRVRPVTTSR